MRPNLVFVGSKDTGLKILSQIRDSVSHIVTFDDRSDERSVFEHFKAFAVDTGIPLSVVTRTESEAAILALRPDLVLVCGWYWLLGPALLASVPLGVAGIHHSLLPCYRGGAPLVWALINGERCVGTSLFFMAPGMDDGLIIAQRTTDVAPTDHIGEVVERAEALALEMVVVNLPAMLTGDARTHRQDESQATYCAQRRPEDGKIDWQWSARRIYDFIRAQSEPYPGAWSTIDGQKVTVWRASVLPEPFYGSPGQIGRLVPDGAIVCCGAGTALLLETIQSEGRRMPARSLLKSIGPRFA